MKISLWISAILLILLIFILRFLLQGYVIQYVYFNNKSPNLNIVSDTSCSINGSLVFRRHSQYFELKLNVNNSGSKQIDSTSFKINSNKNLKIEAEEIEHNNENCWSQIEYPLKNINLKNKEKRYFIIRFKDTLNNKIDPEKIKFSYFLLLNTSGKKNIIQGSYSLEGESEIYYTSPIR